MRRTALFVIITVVIMVCAAAGNCENTGSARIIPGEEWSWKNGANNTFDGEIDLSDYEGGELNISMTTDLPYDETERAESRPVFTIVNEKRIQMLKQTESARCTIDKESPVITFSGRFRLPEKQRVNQITFQFTVTDETGQEITNVRAAINSGSETNERQIYIPVDINTVSAVLICAAAIVWMAVVLKNIHNKKSVRRGQ